MGFISELCPDPVGLLEEANRLVCAWVHQLISQETLQTNPHASNYLVAASRPVMGATFYSAMIRLVPAKDVSAPPPKVASQRHYSRADLYPDARNSSKKKNMLTASPTPSGSLV